MEERAVQRVAFEEEAVGRRVTVARVSDDRVPDRRQRATDRRRIAAVRAYFYERMPFDGRAFLDGGARLSERDLRGGDPFDERDVLARRDR